MTDSGSPPRSARTRARAKILRSSLLALSDDGIFLVMLADAGETALLSSLPRSG